MFDSKIHLRDKDTYKVRAIILKLLHMITLYVMELSRHLWRETCVIPWLYVEDLNYSL